MAGHGRQNRDERSCNSLGNCPHQTTQAFQHNRPLVNKFAILVYYSNDRGDGSEQVGTTKDNNCPVCYPWTSSIKEYNELNKAASSSVRTSNRRQCQNQSGRCDGKYRAGGRHTLALKQNEKSQQEKEIASTQWPIAQILDCRNTQNHTTLVLHDNTTGSNRTKFKWTKGDRECRGQPSSTANNAVCPRRRPPKGSV